MRLSKSIALLVAVLGLAAAIAEVPRHGYVLNDGEGEAACCGVSIKASPKSGTQGGVMLVQPMQPGFSTGLHYHQVADEFFYVISGTGTATISGRDYDVKPGDVMFVPAGEDHRLTAGVETMEILEFLDKPGLDDDFRAEIEEPVTLEKVNAVSIPHGTVYKTLD